MVDAKIQGRQAYRAEQPAKVNHGIRQHRRGLSGYLSRKKWHSVEGVSGSGSKSDNTERIVREVPDLPRRYGVTPVLDVPCGDFDWMRHVDSANIEYLGADIVPELAHANRAFYGSSKLRFLQLALLRDPLPDADLIVCRNCLFHFSQNNVFCALANFAATAALPQLDRCRGLRDTRGIWLRMRQQRDE